MEPAPDRYRTFLSLSGEGIARFELDRPLRAEAPEDEQVEHLLRHGRVAECNELFARFYGREAAQMQGLAMGEVFPSQEPGRLQGIREFIRSGYRLVYAEEEHVQAAGPSRWISGSALGALEDGCLQAFWLCLRDITDRKQGEADRERRGRILEAVAFSAARLLQPGSWRGHADLVLERLGHAAGVARVWLAEFEEGSDGEHFVFRWAWEAPGIGRRVDDPRVRGGVSAKAAGLERLESEIRSGRPVLTLVGELSESEQALPRLMGSKAFAAVPVFANDQAWGFLGFGETRYERVWSGPEVEALKAAAALFGAAIERTRGDAALRESEERYRRLAAATFEGIALTESGILLDANDQLAAMLGYERAAEIIGQSVETFVPEEDHEIVRVHRQSGFEGPSQHRVRGRDGSVLPVEVRARKTPYQGRTVRVTAIRDVSARVQAEELQRSLEAELRQAAEQWRQTFDALDLGIVLADAEGRIVRLNRSALERATGPSFTDAVGRKLADVSDREPWRTMRDLHERIGRSGMSEVAEAREPSDGRAYYMLGSPWPRGPGEHPWRVMTFRDVTAFTHMQTQLRRARLMEAMGSLVAGVAHEVRNPLFSISATVDALEAELGPRLDFAEYATLLRSQVNRLTQLMRDLLEYGKPSVLRRAPTSVAEVVRRAARACATLARERKVTVEEQVPELPALDLDGARIEQALENLLANAIQHAPAASVVRIRGELDATGPEPRVRCIVEDEGPGLPAERERLFEPFFTRRKGGTGLGLPIVERVVTAHGGRVTAENREGGGARFTVHLPAGPPLARSGPA